MAKAGGTDMAGLTRRALGGAGAPLALLVAGLGPAQAGMGGTAVSADAQPEPAAGDFAFQTGEWRVRHRKLKRRLVGDTEWCEFDGRTTAWELMGGAASVEDQIFDDPHGAYRILEVRRRDPQSGLWSLWCWDSRRSEIDPPLRGRFRDGVGTFLGADELDGRPILVRSVWSGVGPTAAHWEQAFSADAGLSWETNWTMRFERER